MFVQSKHTIETTKALKSYKDACDSGRGAIFLAVARGLVSDGVVFDRHYARSVILMGLPQIHTPLPKYIEQRIDFLKSTGVVSNANEYLAFDAMRQAAQCIDQVVRNKAVR